MLACLCLRSPAGKGPNLQVPACALQASPQALRCQVCTVQAALYCIFDGHIGRRSASSCTKLLPEELRVRMTEVKPRLESGEGPGQLWEDVFLATDTALTDTEDGTTATALLVWKDNSGNLCLQVIGLYEHTVLCQMHCWKGRVLPQ